MVSLFFFSSSVFFCFMVSLVMIFFICSSIFCFLVFWFMNVSWDLRVIFNFILNIISFFLEIYKFVYTLYHYSCNLSKNNQISVTTIFHTAICYPAIPLLGSAATHCYPRLTTMSWTNHNDLQLTMLCCSQ